MSIVDKNIKKGDYIIVKSDYDFSNISSSISNPIPRGIIFKVISVKYYETHKYRITGGYRIEKVRCINGDYNIEEFWLESAFARNLKLYTRNRNLKLLLDK